VRVAHQSGLLGDSLVRDLIRAVAIGSDPDLTKDGEIYIASRAIDRVMSEYRKGNSL
jgi:hypothetical protein